MRRALILIGVTITVALQATAQLAPNAPKDRPQSIQEQEVAALEAAIAPYAAEARRTYPAAKRRYQNGLPEGQALYLTTRLRDELGRWEQAFILVHSIEGRTVIGTIASEIGLVSGYAHGQPYTFDERDLVDWLITKPDGTEEGNVVGKFLDTYRP